jgi:chloramphenicol 3-O-phosphotransferase
MRLLFLHGAPASGKHTVAQEVARLTGGRLFDNHVAVDFARAIFDFDAPGFWALVHASRMLALEKAARHGVDLLIQTACYSHPEDLPLLEDFERVLGTHGGQLLPVHLTCSPEALAARVDLPDRVAKKKIATREGLDRCLARWNLIAVPRPDCVTVDTDSMTPAEAARLIVEHFDLALPDGPSAS